MFSHFDGKQSSSVLGERHQTLTLCDCSFRELCLIRDAFSTAARWLGDTPPEGISKGAMVRDKDGNKVAVYDPRALAFSLEAIITNSNTRLWPSSLEKQVVVLVYLLGHPVPMDAKGQQNLGEADGPGWDLLRRFNDHPETTVAHLQKLVNEALSIVSTWVDISAAMPKAP